MTVGARPYSYAYDTNGNLRAETTSRHFDVDHADRMAVFRTQTDGAEPSVYAQYLYDASGQRVKKLVRKQGGPSRPPTTSTISSSTTASARGRRRARTTTSTSWTTNAASPWSASAPAEPGDQGPAVQYHLADHLGSSNVVLDGSGAAVSREEYTPYGETTFGSFASKRYRFTGKERDEESGFTYHGARYYAPWLGRWTSPDPTGPADDLNLYAYVSGNPMGYVDQKGTDKTTPVPAADPVKATGTAPDATQSPQSDISYALTRAQPLGQESTKTGWEPGWLDDFDDSSVDRGVTGAGCPTSTRPPRCTTGSASSGCR